MRWSVDCRTRIRGSTFSHDAVALSALSVNEMVYLADEEMNCAGPSSPPQ